MPYGNHILHSPNSVVAAATISLRRITHFNQAKPDLDMSPFHIPNNAISIVGSAHAY